MCDNLSFINTAQKTLKPCKKMFQGPGWMRKKFIPEKGSCRNMRCKLLPKRSTGNTTECYKHLQHIATEKDILPELNRSIFQISLK